MDAEERREDELPSAAPLGIVLGVRVLTQNNILFCLTEVVEKGFITGDFVRVLRGYAREAENLNDTFRGGRRGNDFSEARDLLSRYERALHSIEQEFSRRNACSE